MMTEKEIEEGTEMMRRRTMVPYDTMSAFLNYVLITALVMGVTSAVFFIQGQTLLGVATCVATTMTLLTAGGMREAAKGGHSACGRIADLLGSEALRVVKDKKDV